MADCPQHDYMKIGERVTTSGQFYVLVCRHCLDRREVRQ